MARTLKKGHVIFSRCKGARIRIASDALFHFIGKAVRASNQNLIRLVRASKESECRLSPNIDTLAAIDIGDSSRLRCEWRPKRNLIPPPAAAPVSLRAPISRALHPKILRKALAIPPA